MQTSLGSQKVISFRARQPDPEVCAQIKNVFLQINIEMQFLCVCRTVVNASHRNPNVMYKVIKRKLSISTRHTDSRLKLARKHLEAGTNWNNMIFLDEKINLDGPHECMFY